MLAALWMRAQSGLLVAGAVLLVLLGAYGAGSRAARRAQALRTAQAHNQAMRTSHEISQKLDALDDDTVRDRASRWVRTKP